MVMGMTGNKAMLWKKTIQMIHHIAFHHLSDKKQKTAGTKKPGKRFVKIMADYE